MATDELNLPENNLIPYILTTFCYLKAFRGVFRGGAMGAKPPLDQRNLLLSGGFQALTGAEPPAPLERYKI